MAQTLVDTSAIERARTAAAGAAGPLQGAADLPPTSTVAFGALAVAPALVRAVEFAGAQLRLDAVQGADHLRRADLALQQAIEDVRALDDAGAGSFAAPAGI